MRRWLAALRFELRKALHARATWVTLVLPSLLAAVTVWITRRAQLADTEQRGVEGIGSAFLPFARGASSGLVLAGILLLFYSSNLLANEGALRTYKTILLRAHTRAEWVAAKLALGLGLALAVLIAIAIVSFVAGALVADYTAIAEEGYVIFEADVMRTQAALALLLVVPPLFALVAFGLMVSAFTDHTGIAAGGCIGAYFVLEVLKGSLADSRVYLFNSFMPSLLDTSYLEALRGFANGMSDTGWEASLVWFNLWTPLLWTVVFVAATLVRFGRRDFAV